MRKKRDGLIDLLTEADIAEAGVVVDNPMIGKLPTREEVEDELEQLLMSM